MADKFDNEELSSHFRIALFGSARIKKGDWRYKMVYSLAKQIGAAGFDIITGGGPGLMDAASRGHHAGRKGRSGHHVGRKGGVGHSIGLTIQLPKEQRDSFHLDVKKDFKRFSERLDHFMALADVVVVAPGGIGTLLELFYTWQLVQVKHICQTPIILMGKMWPGLISWIKKWPLKKGFLGKEDLETIFYANDIEAAMSIITKANAMFEKGGKNLCLNIRKYGL
ncbi:LOG family protein [Candidatus Woesearchaeota archaeon]|nr:LOG family protein [Candidatus Woesearchaeota archaeon]